MSEIIFFDSFNKKSSAGTWHPGTFDCQFESDLASKFISLSSDKTREFFRRESAKLFAQIFTPHNLKETIALLRSSQKPKKVLGRT